MLFYARENVIDYFKKGIFPYKGNVFKTKEKKSEEGSEEESEKGRIKEFIEYIENESKDINYDLFERYFNSTVPNVLVKNS